MRLYPSPLVKINIIDWDVLLLFVIFPFLYPAFYRAAINFTLHFLLYTLSNQRQSLCVFCQWRFSIAPFVLFLRLSSILMVFELMRFYWDRCRGLFAYSFIVEDFWSTHFFAYFETYLRMDVSRGMFVTDLDQFNLSCVFCKFYVNKRLFVFSFLQLCTLSASR